MLFRKRLLSGMPKEHLFLHCHFLPKAIQGLKATAVDQGFFLACQQSAQVIDEADYINNYFW